MRNSKYCLLLCFITTWGWAFSNILYSRFFLRYISFSSIGQTSNLFDWFMVECIIDGLNYSDLLFILPIIAFILLYRRIHSTLSISIKTMKYLSITLLSFLLLDFIAVH